MSKLFLLKGDHGRLYNDDDFVVVLSQIESFYIAYKGGSYHLVVDTPRLRIITRFALKENLIIRAKDLEIALGGTGTMVDLMTLNDQGIEDE
jgi:hypothetical protein